MGLIDKYFIKKIYKHDENIARYCGYFPELVSLTWKGSGTNAKY
jgi:hypothetical protein